MGGLNEDQDEAIMSLALLQVSGAALMFINASMWTSLFAAHLGFRVPKPPPPGGPVACSSRVCFRLHQPSSIVVSFLMFCI